MAFTKFSTLEIRALFFEICHSFSLSFMILVSVFVCGFFIVTGWCTKSYKGVITPPSPPRLPIVGNLHQLGKHAHQKLRFMALSHGPLMLIHLGSVPAYVISSADVAKEIFKTHDIIFSNRSSSSIFRRLLYDGKDILLAPYGDYWRHIRGIAVLQLLNSQRVQSYEAVRDEEVAIMIESIKSSKSSINLSTMMGTVTNGILCRIAFGKKYSLGDGEENFEILFDEFAELMGVFNIGDYIPWLNWLNHLNGLDTRVEKNFLKLDALLDHIIDDHIANQHKKGPKELVRMDLVDVLLENHQKSESISEKFPKTSMKAILADMFAGGSDTTHAALEWAMTELIRHPSTMVKVQKQIRFIIGDRESITRNDIQKMEYLKAVIQEVLRMYPPIPLVPRISSKEVNLYGYDIPANTRVFINLTAIGRDATRWDEPDEFRPERFLDARVCDSRAREFDFMPFGAGRRGCPGIVFGSAVMELVLANLLLHFDWSLPDGVKGEDLDVDEKAGLTVHKKNPLILVATLAPICKRDTTYVLEYIIGDRSYIIIQTETGKPFKNRRFIKIDERQKFVRAIQEGVSDSEKRYSARINVQENKG